MPEPRRIRRALISVYDKTGIVEFARALHEEFGVEIISTGGTARVLAEAGIPVTLIETITGFPEMLDGRVKTLHPRIHAAILADRDNPEHMRQLAEAGIEPIDMVVVHLYPFEKTVADPNCTFEQAIEMIDIGGVALLRAAAKNHRHVLVFSEADAVHEAIRYLRGDYADSAADDRLRFASNVLLWTSVYDAQITEWLGRQLATRTAWPVTDALYLRNWGDVRYGENAQQTAQLADLDADSDLNLVLADEPGSMTDVQQRMSFNNYLDADAALGLCAELTRAGEKLWHRFPTGVSKTCGTGFQPVNLQARSSTRRASAREKPTITRETIAVRNLPHIQKPQATYFITFQVQQGTLAPPERDITLSASKFWHGRKMTLHAAVVMPDHVHLLLTPHQARPGHWIPLGELLHSIKRFSSLEINELRGTTGKVWMDESFDRVVRDEKEFIEKWEYIQANPVTAGLAARGEYPWFWASEAGFMETLAVRETGLETRSTEHRFETGATEPHRLETGATEPHRLETGATAGDAPRAAYACCFIKHTNPCGVGIVAHANTSPEAVFAAQLEAYRRAYLGDPKAAMGGILACNFEVNADFAALVMETYDRFGKPLKEAGAANAPGGFFVEVWIAPGFTDDAVAIIRGRYDAAAARPAVSETRIDSPPRKKWGEKVRLLDVDDMAQPPDETEPLYRSIAGGMLVQTPDLVGLNEDQWKLVTKRSPTEQEMADLRLAWLVCKHTKSNAISIVRDGMLIGNGAGQMSRVMSCRIATWLARENGHLPPGDRSPTGPWGVEQDQSETGLPMKEQKEDRSETGPPRVNGPVAASDAFFPFRDGPDILIDAGVTAIIQPGGSKRDGEVIAACDERNIAMIFTGTRHFRH